MENLPPKPLLSVVIRTLNEGKWLGEVLKSLRNQTVKNIEIIILDSGSKDKTLSIAKEFNCKIVQINQEDFSYPYALNIGIKNAKAEIVGILSGHSIPISEKWAERGLKHFRDKDIAGISGPIRALPDANFIEKIYYSFDAFLWYFFPRIVFRHNTLDNRNSMIRKSDWETYPFNEVYVKGCEDYDWAQYMIKHLNKRILFDSKFQAKHSHSGIGKPTDLELWWKVWRFENKKIREKYKDM